jgi:hypothetical protein
VSNAHDRFLQLARMLGWGARTGILMLWVAYFDESGLPGPDGSLTKLTIGGAIASLESWERLSLRWFRALAAMNLPCFHMSHFQARKPPYSSWTEAERRDRLNTLLEIIGEPGRHCYGFTNIARPDETTQSLYERCARDLLLEFGNKYEDEFAVVFAHHPEFARHVGLLNQMIEHGMGGKIRSCTIAKPIDTLPLQAADIIAYEIAREEREVKPPERYPLRRIRELGATFKLVSAAD